MNDQSVPQVTKWRPADVVPERDVVDPSLVLEGDPEWWTAVVWTSPDSTTIVGTFRGTPGRFLYEPPATEATFVTAGHVIITGDDGSIADCRAGDSVILRAGSKNTFDVRETLEDTWVWSSPTPIEL